MIFKTLFLCSTQKRSIVSKMCVFKHDKKSTFQWPKKSNRMKLKNFLIFC
jgi:hypothetical protein